MPALDLTALDRWVGAYGRAWESNDAREVEALFSADAVYYVSPFAEPRRGREAIVRAWVSDPESQREVRFAHDAVAVEGNVGVAHWHVTFRPADADSRVEMDGVLVLRFDDDGRCTDHREWYARREAPAAREGGERERGRGREA